LNLAYRAATTDSSQWKTSSGNIHFEKGIKKTKIYFVKRVFNFKKLCVEKGRKLKENI
jgi:hypothetical protein